MLSLQEKAGSKAALAPFAVGFFPMRQVVI